MEPNQQSPIQQNNTIPTAQETKARLAAIAEKEKGKYIIESEIRKRQENTELVNQIPTNKGEIVNKKSKKLFGIFDVEGRNRKAVIAITIASSILLGFFLITATIFFTGLDTLFFKINLTAAVVDSNTEPIAGAQILLDNKIIATTNDNGIFEIDNLESGKITLLINADGYFPLEENVSLGRGFLDYTVEKVFRLENGTTAEISGQLLVPDNDFHTFDQDTLLINDEDFRINADGTFNITGVPAGEVIFEYKSSRYKDFKKSANLKSGENEITPIDLVPAGDINGDVLSFIREDIPDDIVFTVDNVETSNIDIDTGKGEFTIQDLDIDKTYTLRIEATGIETREYTVQVKQGINIIPEISLTEKGSTVFVAELEEDRTPSIYISSYDGENITKLTSERFNPSSLYFDTATNEIFFTSNANTLSAEPSGKFDTPYRLDLSSSTLSALITEEDETGVLFPNFEARLFAEAFNDDNLQIQIRDFNGKETEILRTVTNKTAIDLKVSDSGEYVYLLEEDNETEERQLVVIDVDSKTSRVIDTAANLKIEDVSVSGNRIAYTASATSSSFKDLFLYDYAKTEKKSLLINAEGNEYQFIKDSEDELLFWQQKNGNKNIFSINTESNQETKYTSLTGSEEIDALYQGDKYVYYRTATSLYILDLDKPQNFKRVIQSDEITDIR